MTTIWIILGIIILNIIFGFWRSRTRRFSPQWFMAIHIPVPVAIILRLSFLGWNWLMVPVFVAAFAAGQYSGGRISGMVQKQKARTQITDNENRNWR